MPSRSAVYAQAKRHAEIERSVIEALARRAAEQRAASTPRRKAEEILPADIWLRILGQLDDPNLLWSSCLRVCRSFRHCVETLFAQDHIRDSKTLITFDLGDNYRSVELAFDRFSEDGSRAIFREKSGCDLGKATTDRWKSVMQETAAATATKDRVDSPPFTIAVRRFVNDTRLPGLEIDYDQRTISFDWRGMYSCFFREEDWVEKQQALWAHDDLALSHRFRRPRDARDMDEVDAMTAIFHRL